MEMQDILSKVDHTNLSQTATFEDIKKLIDDGVKYAVASVCIQPCFVKQAKEYIKANHNNSLKVCTVIGFPNGYNSTATKVFETQDAVKNGADEIDMVINITQLKAKNFDFVFNEINEIKSACNGKLLKVIVETCLLTEEEKIKMCEIVSTSNADFIKTSTGFSTGGATFEDVSLFAKHLANGKKIKASGGIKNFEQAEKYIELGCSRLGTSSLVKQAKQM